MKAQNIAWSGLGTALVMLGALATSATAQNTAQKAGSLAKPAPTAPKKSVIAPKPKDDFSHWGGNMYIRTMTDEEIERYVAYSASYSEGRAFLDKKKPDAAIAAFKRAMEVDPTASVGLFMGQAYSMKGNWEEAIKWYRKDIYPSNPRQLEGGAWGSPGPMLEYALLLLKTGQTTEAITIYNATIEDINTISRGDGTVEARRPVALPAWDTSTMGSDPKALEALVRIGRSTFSTGSDDPLAETAAAVKLMPNLAVAHYFRAEELKLRVSSRAEAAAEYRKAAELGDDATAGAARAALERPEFKKLTPTDTK